MKNNMDYERLSKLVGELETLIPEDKAVARIERRRARYGLVANQSACLRMGSEMLKAAAVQTPVDEEPRPSRDNRPRPVTRRKLPGFFAGDSAVQIERLERHDVLPTAPAPSFSRKAFFASMATAMSISIFTILGAIVSANTAVDVYVIPNMGDSSFAAVVPMPNDTMPVDETASADAAPSNAQ